MARGKIIRFLEIYAVFMVFALLVNLSMELLIPTPEEKQATGIVMFYALFSIPGSIVLLLKNYRPVRMGLLSLVLGFVFEFAFMLPDWVLNIYTLKMGGDVIGAVIVSAFYWFIAWGLPSYAVRKYLAKSGAPRQGAT
jgi:hypothetical protein